MTDLHSTTSLASEQNGTQHDMSVHALSNWWKPLLATPYRGSRARRRCFSALFSFVIAAVLLTIVVPSPAEAQSQTGWHVNDEPTLFGPAEWWKEGARGKGYGDNNYRYTLAIGGEETADNWAHWYLYTRNGRQQIQAYVPCNHATATVEYEIIASGTTLDRVRLNQQPVCGWQPLGEFDANGRDITILVADNRAAENFRRDGVLTSQIGVDAIRIRCVARCGNVSVTAPANLSASHLDEPPHSRGVLEFTWAAPMSSGNVEPTHYEWRIWRNGRSWEGTTTSTSIRLGNPRWSTKYWIQVGAVYGGIEGPVSETSFTMPASTTEPQPGGPGSNQPYVSDTHESNYDYSGRGCSDNADKWAFYQRQCTSYVAWRLNDAGISFHNTRYTNGGSGQVPLRDGVRRWSHAKYWGEAAEAVGIDVDGMPTSGAVALWEYGGPNVCRHVGVPKRERCYGHVAYVKSVSDDGNTITVSEYNYGAVRCSYGERTLKRGKQNWPDKFIHFERANP